MMINPFDLGPEDQPGEPSADKISTLLSLLDLMFAPEGREELNVEEKSLLDGLIRVAYMDAHFPRHCAHDVGSGACHGSGCS